MNHSYLEWVVWNVVCVVKLGGMPDSTLCFENSLAFQVSVRDSVSRAYF